MINSFVQGSFVDEVGWADGDMDISSRTAAVDSTPQMLTRSIQALNPRLTVPANIATEILVFRIQWAWTSIFLFCTLILILSSLLSVFLKRKTLHRPYIPFISSLLRESRNEDGNVGFPDGGVTLSGWERSRSMKRLRVRIGDLGAVDGGHEVGTGVAIRVGRIGVGVGCEGEVERLRGDRLYI